MIEQEYIAGQKLDKWISENLATWLMRVGVLAVSFILILSLYEVVTTNKIIWYWLNLVMVPIAVANFAFMLNYAQKGRELDIAKN